MGKQKQTSMDNMIPFVEFMPDPLAPVPLERAPRWPHQTDQQYAAQWEMTKRAHRRWVVALSAFQAMATIYGYHKTCKKPQCRRKHRCTGIRLPDSNDDYPVPLFPLCGTIEMAERALEVLLRCPASLARTIVQWLPQTAAYIRVRKC